MTKLAMLVLACLAMGLGGVIAIESTPHKLKGPVPQRADILRPGLVAPRAGDVRQVQTWVEIILARPLFEPSRRPPATAESGTGVPGFPRLTGIIIMPHQSEAIFAVPGKTQPVVVTAGSRLNGVLIKFISAGSVVVVDTTGARMIRPSFASGPNPAAAAPASVMVDLPPAPSRPGTSPFASIRGLSGRPLGLAAQPDTAPSMPALASPGVPP